VAKYTDNYILLISSSKIFSYAGQRSGFMAIGNKIVQSAFPDLKRFYPQINRYAKIYGAVYACLRDRPLGAICTAAIFKNVKMGN